MGVFRRGPRPGTPWTGYAAIFDDESVDHRRGWYALTDDGKHLRRPVIRLTCVTSGEEHDLYVSKKGDPPLVEGKRTVEFEAEPDAGANLAVTREEASLAEQIAAELDSRREEDQ